MSPTTSQDLRHFRHLSTLLVEIQTIEKYIEKILFLHTFSQFHIYSQDEIHQYIEGNNAFHLMFTILK